MFFHTVQKMFAHPRLLPCKDRARGRAVGEGRRDEGTAAETAELLDWSLLNPEHFSACCKVTTVILQLQTSLLSWYFFPCYST